MCGIAGYVNYAKTSSAAELRDIALRQGRSLLHRGPDSGDVFVDAGAQVALSHRRLAIVDLSPAGFQPMLSSCERYVIVYNGEIYNADELRAGLRGSGRCLRGTSDTEALLEACAEWGIDRALARCNGMFAFALWDRSDGTVSLARDRLGIKPLYYANLPSGFSFGSELRALRECPNFSASLNHDAIASYLRYLYVPAPHSVYQDVRKLEPGTVLQISTRHYVPDLIPRTYWSLREVAQAGVVSRSSRSNADVVLELEALLSDAVKRCMIADVPLGVFLSGGIDSATVAALMQENSALQIKTFSIGFEDKNYNEADHAAALAQHLGTEHTALTLTSAQARDVIPSLPTMFDEPFSDSSQIPTYLLSAMTRRHVTVALSGDGGDEVFAGYNRYQIAARVAMLNARLPEKLRVVLAKLMTAIPQPCWDQLFRLFPAQRRPAQAGNKVHKFARAFQHSDDGFYRDLVSQWDEPEKISTHGHELETVIGDQSLRKAFPELMDRMQFWDSVGYLPDDILTKVDRASMAVSLEVRVPLLDHRVVEYAWALPGALKMRGTTSKWLLRQVLLKRVPQAYLDGPKRGFAVPIDDWLRGPLKEWAGDMLARNTLAQFDLVNPEPVAKAWQQHLGGRANHGAQLWNVLMLQSWCSEYLGQRVPQRAAH